MLGPQKQSQRHDGKIDSFQGNEADQLANIPSSDQQQIQFRGQLPQIDYDFIAMSPLIKQNPYLFEKNSQRKLKTRGILSHSVKKSGPGSYQVDFENQSNQSIKYSRHQNDEKCNQSQIINSFPLKSHKELNISNNTLLEPSLHLNSKKQSNNGPIHHKHHMSGTLIQLKQNNLLGTIKKFAFNFNKKAKCQNARSNSYLFDLRKNKEDKVGISAATIGLVKKNATKNPAKKLYNSMIAGQSGPKTMCTSNASTIQNLHFSSPKLKDNYNASPPPLHKKKVSIRKKSNNFSFQNQNQPRQISLFTLERAVPSEAGQSQKKHGDTRSNKKLNIKSKQFQVQNKSMQMVRMNEYSDEQSSQSPNFTKLNISDIDDDDQKVQNRSQVNLGLFNSSYHDQQFQQLEEYYQNKGLAKRKGMNTSHKFHANHSKNKDTYYKGISNVLDQKMEQISQLIVEKKKIEMENKWIKSDIQKNYREIDNTYSKMHETKDVINNQILINEETRVAIGNIKNQIYLIRLKMKETKQNFIDQNTSKVEIAVKKAQKQSQERDQMLDQMMQLAKKTKNEKDALVKKLKCAKECFSQLSQKVKYQRQIDGTRKKLLIEKGNLMKQLINNEMLTTKTIKSQAGKESFNVAKNLKTVLSKAKLYQDERNVC